MVERKPVKKETSSYTVGVSFFDIELEKKFIEGEPYPADSVDKKRLEALKKAGVLKEGE